MEHPVEIIKRLGFEDVGFSVEYLLWGFPYGLR